METYSKSPYFADFEVGENSSSEIFSKPRGADLNSYSCSTRKIECVE